MATSLTTLAWVFELRLPTLDGANGSAGIAPLPTHSPSITDEVGASVVSVTRALGDGLGAK